MQRATLSIHAGFGPILGGTGRYIPTHRLLWVPGRAGERFANACGKWGSALGMCCCRKMATWVLC